ncbi:MAG: Uma2 family endonuclease [Methylococcales bacterium]|nr:Uma2 family endonuclease [Methylococcales bacterium]
MSFPNYKVTYISEEEYLEDEKISDIKHEYFDGEIFAMSGGSINHQGLTLNVSSELRHHLKGTPCEAFSSDIKVRADNGRKYFYPDVLVSCNNDDGNKHFSESPRIIVEVLSNSTRKFDKNLKRQIYQSIPSLEEYVLIEQDRVEIEVSRKSTNWQPVFYFIDDEITFESIDLTLPVLEIYQRVDNQEMCDFLKTLDDSENRANLQTTSSS